MTYNYRTLSTSPCELRAPNVLAHVLFKLETMIRTPRRVNILAVPGICTVLWYLVLETAMNDSQSAHPYDGTAPR